MTECAMCAHAHTRSNIHVYTRLSKYDLSSYIIQKRWQNRYAINHLKSTIVLHFYMFINKHKRKLVMKCKMTWTEIKLLLSSSILTQFEEKECTDKMISHLA